MKKFLFLGVGFLSLGTVLVLQANAQSGCYYTTGSSRLSCASNTRICSTCATRQPRCYTGCSGTSRSNVVYRRVRQVPTKCSYCNSYSYGVNTSVNYRVQRSTVTYRSRVNTAYYPRSVYNYRYVTPTKTTCTSHATCSTKVPVVTQLVRPVTYNSYYPYNNSAVNNTVIVNVN